ncbi:MAG: anti-sigma factor [Acidobacteriaceae bacterium]|nr:anti-sigma factor [Acidobacteriaceae bacterium]
MPCNGLAANIYDLYVLGLLDGQDLVQLEAHIQQQCPACLRGVQRSMNLWAVFAATLEDAEPSAGFRARLIQIAELSKKVLTFPKTSFPSETSQAARWGLMAGGAALAVAVVAAWYAGHASGALDEQRLNANLIRMAQQLASTQLRMNEQTAKVRQLENALHSSGKIPALDQQSLAQRRLLQAQAQADQYKAILDRQEQAIALNTRLLDALSNPGARLITMKGSDVAGAATAYAVFIENSKLLFVGANLPKLGEGRQFQLWVVRKEDPKIVSAGVFSATDDHRGVISFDEGSLLSDVSLLRVTDEQSGGNSAPTGPKLLEGSVAEEE